MNYIYAELRAIWLENYVLDDYIEGYLEDSFEEDEENE